MQRLKGDQGAVAVLVAIAMTALLGFGAIVIDIGQLYAERRQLQNGADAAALAVVLDCGSSSGCAADIAAAASAKARQNANDDAASVASPSGPAICGRGGGLIACDPASGLGPWDCQPLPSGPLADRYVQVRTQTRQSAGGSLVPPFLIRSLPGNSTYPGSTVRACARASWGGPAAMSSGLSLTISYCEWDVATSGGAVFAPPPPAVPPTSAEKVLKLHSTATDSTSCPAAGHSGFDAPGAFGWLDDQDTADCSSDANISGSYDDKTGLGTPTACKDRLIAARTNREVIYLPIYNGISGGQYTLQGFAAFVVTGYRLPGLPPKDSWLYPSNPERCTKSSDKCLYGYFTQPLVPAAGTVGGPSMGVTVVQMSG